MTSEHYDVTAIMPEGATKEQIPEMLQRLLEERFRVATHRETRQADVYHLVVGKSGMKPMSVNRMIVQWINSFTSPPPVAIASKSAH